MSDTVVNDSPTDGDPPTTNGFFLDGEAPRLGAAPTIAVPPSEHMPVAAPPAPVLLGDAPTLPVVSPVLTPPTTTLPGNSTPDDSEHDDDSSAEPEHPMAHLMPSKSMPSEAGRRAAEIRAAQKAKSKKIKIGLIAGFMLVSAVLGPPLGKWLVDAINEAGDTTTVVEPAE